MNNNKLFLYFKNKANFNEHSNDIKKSIAFVEDESAIYTHGHRFPQKQEQESGSDNLEDNELREFVGYPTINSFPTSYNTMWAMLYKLWQDVEEAGGLKDTSITNINNLSFYSTANDATAQLAYTKGGTISTITANLPMATALVYGVTKLQDQAAVEVSLSVVDSQYEPIQSIEFTNDNLSIDIQVLFANCSPSISADGLTTTFISSDGKRNSLYTLTAPQNTTNSDISGTITISATSEYGAVQPITIQYIRRKQAQPQASMSSNVQSLSFTASQLQKTFQITAVNCTPSISGTYSGITISSPLISGNIYTYTVTATQGSQQRTGTIVVTSSVNGVNNITINYTIPAVAQETITIYYGFASTNQLTSYSGLQSKTILKNYSSDQFSMSKSEGTRQWAYLVIPNSSVPSKIEQVDGTLLSELTEAGNSLQKTVIDGYTYCRLSNFRGYSSGITLTYKITK